jgi:hypothetical protein
MSDNIDFTELKARAYRGKDIIASKRQPDISNEELKQFFDTVKDEWYLVEDLKELLKGKITVNVDNPKRTPINSRYLTRMHDIVKKETGKEENWRQHTAILRAKRYVKFSISDKKKRD